MNAVEIEEAISELVIEDFDPETFAYAFLEAFGNNETTIKKLRKGKANRTDIDGAVLQNRNIHILATDPAKGHKGVEAGLKALRDSPKTLQQKAKFILATDGKEIQAEDLNSGEPLSCDYTDLPNHFGFLLPLAGITTVSEIKNNPIDIKATSRLDKLYVALLEDERNKDWAEEKNRARFNHFMAQLIFCFFAEDTGIFRGDNLFTATVQQMSESDGSNTNEIITHIFAAMDLDPRVAGERDGVRPYADQFPYVNGGLFGEGLHVPHFSKMARTYLLRAGDLDWTAINPDIFGSMIQAVADDEERGELGMHYTSVPNILKVLNPLFLDSLNADLERAGNNKQQLGKLKKRLSRIRVFDPACGSGNFLVIAYKHMREIEHKASLAAGWESEKSVIPLTNFRGIEIKGFAAEIARLALIIAEFQCDEIYMGQREALALFLPLEKTNWITRGNALRLDWLSVCPPTGETNVKLVSDDLLETPLNQSEIDFENEGGETYICGNPPYVGSRNQTAEQKNNLKSVFDNRISNWKSLDYISGWLYLAARFCRTQKCSTALVTTNSVCQGLQVPILWPHILKGGVRIKFAHLSFKWQNLASHNAGVTVAVVGFGICEGPCKIYDGERARTVETINAYLIPSKTVFLKGATESISGLDKLFFGNMPRDGGHLSLNRQEFESAKNEGVPDRFIKKYSGSAELIRGIPRYCIWVSAEDYADASKVPFLNARFEKTRQIRLKSSAASTRGFAKYPYRFAQTPGVAKDTTIVVPSVSSESREYLPTTLLRDGVVSNLAFALYDAPLWNMALIASKLHLVWIATVCGKLKTDYRYSNTLGWNTFPVPALTARHKEELTRAAENILLAREAHFPATIADLYKPDAMPENLRAAHNENDRILEEIYIGRKLKNDTERLEKLFEMYTEMTKEKTHV